MTFPIHNTGPDDFAVLAVLSLQQWDPSLPVDFLVSYGLAI